jgi:hypothetical protein
MARPREYDAEDLAIKLEAYIEREDQPFIQEFCLEENVSVDTIYRLEKDNMSLSEAIKKALRKQEVYILKNASTGKINPVFGIFRLKQKCFGYTDKAEFDVTAKQELPDHIDIEKLKAERDALLKQLTDEDLQVAK